MKKVLIVDDDSHILSLGSALLEEAGMYVATCNSVVLALEKLRGDPVFDLILCDAGMPQLSGFDLIRTLKRDSQLKTLPVAMLTGRKEKENIRRAIELGVEDYIIKPIDPTDFLKRVLELLDSSTETSRPLPPMSHRLPRPEKATATLALELVRVFENGCTLKSPQYLDEGTILWIGSPAFREMGLHSPQMRVMSSRLHEDGNPTSDEIWMIHTSFHNLKAEDPKKIKAWLQSKLGTSKAS